MLERRIELSTGPGGTLPLAPGLMVAILATITMQDLTHEDIPTARLKYNNYKYGIDFLIVKQFKLICQPFNTSYYFKRIYILLA